VDRTISALFLYRAAVLVLVALASSCATVDQQAEVSPGSEELERQLAKQKFRGRWWSYYGRAAIYLDFHRYEDAEADLRQALSKRDDDQRWARTYGLHLIPEYFPNRELGVTLYFQERYEDAVSHLEASIDDVFTARAAYYLDRAREKVVSQQNLDNEPPEVTLVSPAVDRIHAALELPVEVRASDDTYISRVVVNHSDLPLSVTAQSVEVSTSIPVTSGENRIFVDVTDIAGRTTTEEWHVSADLDGPAVSFHAAQNGAARVRGVIADASDIAYMHIAGHAAELRHTRNDTVEFEARAPRIIGRGDLEFECADVHGNVTTGRVQPSRELFAAADGSVQITVQDYPSREIRLALDVAKPLLPETLDDLESPVVRFTNLREGQRYLQPEVAVNLLLLTRYPLARIAVNGEDILGFLTGQPVQQLTTRVALRSVGEHTITASLSDMRGNRASQHIEIARALPTVHQTSNLLSVALLGNLWRHEAGAEMEYARFIARELPRELIETERFNVVEREKIDAVLDEQQLVNALASPDERQALGRLRIADLLLIGDTRRYDDHLEIVVHAIDPFTTRDTLIDVYGPVRTLEDLQSLIETLALRIYQEFPRVQGEVLEVENEGQRVRSDIAEADRVREAAECLVYRESQVIDPQTGQFLGIDLIPIAEGSMAKVKRNQSLIRITEPVAADVPRPADLIITK